MIRDLGTLGGAESAAVAINERGQVVGWSVTRAGARHLFLWEKGRMRDLGVSVTGFTPLAINNRGQIAGSRPNNVPGFVWDRGVVRTLGAPRSEPFDINDIGQVVGTASGGNPFVWQDGRLRYLARLPGFRWVDAKRINEKGQIVGAAWTTEPHALEWNPDGHLVDLGSVYTSGTVSEALAINDRGQVVGSITDELEQRRGALWANGRLTILPGLRSVGDSYSALDINRSGQILGFTYPRGLGRAQNARAFLWTGTRARSLGTLIPDCYDDCDTTPADLNDAGQVVGVTSLPSARVQHAFVWQAGHMYDLGTLPGDDGPSAAVAINEHNQVVGTSTVAGKRHAVLWTLKGSRAR